MYVVDQTSGERIYVPGRVSGAEHLSHGIEADIMCGSCMRVFTAVAFSSDGEPLVVECVNGNCKQKNRASDSHISVRA